MNANHLSRCKCMHQQQQQTNFVPIKVMLLCFLHQPHYLAAAKQMHIHVHLTSSLFIVFVWLPSIQWVFLVPLVFGSDSYTAVFFHFTFAHLTFFAFQSFGCISNGRIRVRVNETAHGCVCVCVYLTRLHSQ